MPLKLTEHICYFNRSLLCLSYFFNNYERYLPNLSIYKIADISAQFCSDDTMIRLLLFLFVLADTKKLPDVQWISTNSM